MEAEVGQIQIRNVNNGNEQSLAQIMEGSCVFFSGNLQIKQDVSVKNILYPNRSNWIYHRQNWIKFSGQVYIVGQTKRLSAPTFWAQIV